MLKEKGRAGFSKWRRSAKKPSAGRPSPLLLHLRAVAVKTTANLEQKLGRYFLRARRRQIFTRNTGNPIYIYSSQQFLHSLGRQVQSTFFREVFAPQQIALDSFEFLPLESSHAFSRWNLPEFARYGV
jgi:hypothetical protein